MSGPKPGSTAAPHDRCRPGYRRSGVRQESRGASEAPYRRLGDRLLLARRGDEEKIHFPVHEDADGGCSGAGAETRVNRMFPPIGESDIHINTG